MPVQPYDAAERHARYERTKQLKGRSKGASKASSSKPSHSSTPLKGHHQQTQISQARVIRVREKLGRLKSALSEAEAELSSRRQSAKKTQKKNSDGKSTAKEKQASKDYRDKHKTALATKAKKASSSSSKSSSGGGKSKSSSSSVANMNTQELRARVIKIRGAITVARRLLSNATVEHGQLAHSAIVSEPDVNERFARFQSAERGPST